MDTERVERILHPDGSDEEITVNKVLESGDVMNDLKKGRYSVTVTIGPSYQTARQETLATLLDAAKTVPNVANVAGDLIASRIDDPIAPELARRLRVPLIQQGIIVPTEQDKKNMPPPKPPDPMQQAELQHTQALASEATAKAQIAASKANSSDLEKAKLIADIVGQHLKNILDSQLAHAGNPDVLTAQVEAENTRANTAQTLATPPPQAAQAA
jgi:hypothetical protein